MKVTKRDIIWNYIGTVISLGSNFLLLPFMMYFLDSEVLGLWYVFLSIGGIVTLFDFGFNPTFARNIAYCWSGATTLSKTDVNFIESGELNIVLMKKVIYTCKRIYLLISVLALLILLTFGTVYINSISGGIDKLSWVISWIIYSFAVFLNLYYGYYTTFLRGVGAITKVNTSTIISRVFQMVISIWMMYLGYGIIAVSIGYLAYGFILRTTCKSAFYKHGNIGNLLKDEKTVITASDTREMFEVVWHNAWKDGLVSLSKYLSSQASVMICSMYLGLTATGIYSISVQLITAIATISGSLYTAYQPALQAAYINNDVDRSKKLMSTAMTVYCIIFMVGMILLITIGIPILKIIKPETIFSLPILITIGVYEFLLKNHSYYASYISNTNNVPYMNAFLISSGLGIILAIVFIKTTNLGVWGLIGAQIISQAIYNNWKWPIQVMKSLNINQIDIIIIGVNEIRKHILTRKKSNTCEEC